jgi:hypothetical protein
MSQQKVEKTIKERSIIFMIILISPKIGRNKETARTAKTTTLKKHKISFPI